MFRCSRRDWMIGGTAAACAMLGPGSASRAIASPTGKALISITLDLEMSRNFPTWETTSWDYEKGNLDGPTKRYAREAARRVRDQGSVIHFFAVGQVFEQADIGWLQEIADEGHPIGNHTYDHINVRATRKEDLQFRFQRAPWLLPDWTLVEIIRENILLTTKAMRTRLGIQPRGFRTPGGFNDGLHPSPEIRELLREQGYTWVSSLYPSHPNTAPMERPTTEVFEQIAHAQVAAQPFAYPDGLIEIPMSPISDIGAFRTGRWQIEWFLESVARSVRHAIENRLVFDFLAHPSCLGVVDPEFRTIDLICQLVRDAGDRAELCDLDTIAARYRSPAAP
jgi:peptidoglycan/xylan/chitin deacetylase (PgdA/CDA1 family)